jgi:hypothetical protein
MTIIPCLRPPPAVLLAVILVAGSHGPAHPGPSATRGGAAATPVLDAVDVHDGGTVPSPDTSERGGSPANAGDEPALDRPTVAASRIPALAARRRADVGRGWLGRGRHFLIPYETGPPSA